MDQFTIGERSLLDLLDSENEYYESSRAYLEAQYTLEKARVRLLAASGSLAQTLGITKDGVPDVLNKAEERISYDPNYVCPAVRTNFEDELNILKATFLAMRRSFLDLRLLPPYAIIDGNSRPDHFPCKTVLVVKGDSKVASIAAASIIAKVSRDRYMRCLAKKFPGYGWEKNFGYGVPFHKSALKSLGVTSEHRRSFAPIYNMLC